MHHIVELHFDDQTEKKLRAAAAICQPDNVWKPHITLTSSEGFNIDAALPDLHRIFDGMLMRTIVLSYLGLFPLDSDHKILYAGISPDSALCQLHEDVYKVVQKNSVNVFDFVRPGFMVFHATLAQKISNNILAKLVRDLEGLVPMQGHITNAAVVTAPDAQELTRFKFVSC